MDQTLINFITIFLLLFIIILFIKNTKNGKTKLPPSPPKLPLIGNLHQLGSLPHQSLRSLSRKHGPIMLMQLGHAPTLVISCSELVKEMIKNHDIVISNRAQTTAAHIYLYGCLDIAFAPYGEYWRQIRKTCVFELMSMKRVHFFQFVRDEEVDVLVEKLHRACSNGDTVNLTEMFLDVSNYIISRYVFGEKSDGDDGKKRFGELSRQVMEQFVSLSIGDFFPSLWWVDVLTGLVSRLKKTFKEFDSFFDEVIEEHKVFEGKEHNEKEDFVDILLQLKKDGLLGFDLTPNRLKAILMDMFVGGTGTTATAMEWIMAELMKNPTTMKRAQEEVRKVVGGKAKIDKNDLNQMVYLKCVIKETLRLHPPLPLLVPREILETINIGGYNIPPKTRIMVNTWAIQRDPRFWDKADDFTPERFENNDIDFRGQDFNFVPFGFGRRGCPGMLLGIASIEYVVANLLCWFDWALPDGMSVESLDMSEAAGLTVQKKVALHLVPICKIKFGYEC